MNRQLAPVKRHQPEPGKTRKLNKIRGSGAVARAGYLYATSALKDVAKNIGTDAKRFPRSEERQVCQR
jgi:hypothetical protein